MRNDTYIFTLSAVLFALILPGSLIIGLEEEENDPMGDVKRSVGDPEMSISSPTYLGESDENEIIYHPNGKVYHLYSHNYYSNDYIYYLYVDPMDGGEEERIELNVQGDLVSGILGEFSVSEDGNITGIIWYEVYLPSKSSNEIVVARIKIDVEADVFEEDLYDIQPLESGDTVRNVDVLEFGGELYAGFWMDDYYHVYGNLTEEIPDRVIQLKVPYVARDTLSLTSNGSSLLIARQNELGEIVLHRYGPDYQVEESEVIYELPDAFGWDNFVEVDHREGRTYLYVYLDELDEGRYARATAVVYDEDLSVINSRNLKEVGSDLDLASTRPILGSDRSILLNGSCSKVFTLNSDLEDIGAFDIDYIHPEYLTPLKEAEAWEVNGQTVIMFRDDFSYMAFSMYPSEGIPIEGYLKVEGNRTISDEETLVLRGLIIGDQGHLKIENSQVIMNLNTLEGGPCILNRGSFDIIRSHIVGESFGSYWGSFVNNGDLKMVDSHINISMENTGRLSSFGEDLFYNPVMGCELIAGDIIMDGLVLDENSTRYSIFRRSGDGEDELSMVNITLLDCDIRYVFDIIWIDGPHRVMLSNSTFENIYRFVEKQYDNEYGIVSISGCEFKNVSGLEFTNRYPVHISESNFTDIPYNLRFENGNLEITDTTFRDSPSILWGDGGEDLHGSSIKISGCVFENCDHPIEDPLAGSINIDNTTFEGCNRSVFFSDREFVSIVDNVFISNNVSVEFESSASWHIIGEITPGKMLGDLHINRNIFRDNEVDIHYVDNRLFDVDYFDYEDEKKIMEEPEYDLIDCRYNYFRYDDPHEVSKHISPGIYFLPYYTLEGGLITTDDNDLDGMDDDWERKNGLDPLYYFDRFSDPDRDRYSNYEEYRTKTDPKDKDSNPATYIKSGAVIAGLIFIYLPFVCLVSYFFYIQYARWNQRIENFNGRYWVYSKRMGSKSGSVKTGGAKTDEQGGGK